MKKLIFLLLLPTIVAAQDTVTDNRFKNEVKLNTLYLAIGAIEIEYEHLLDTKSAFGLAITIPYRNLNEAEVDFLITPYYRWYFGKKYASGFFLEAFGMYASRNGKQDIILGPSLGGKFIFGRKYLAEINFGLGAVLTANNVFTGLYLPIVPRLGIKIGRRFKKIQ